jgi:dTDP-4-dehydrorhamnose 3,5-epimerase
MDIQALAVPDAWVCTPAVHRDQRGEFMEWFRQDTLAETIGRRVEIVQANRSRSTRGVVRGVHVADVPPGQAKFVYCAVGAVLDIVIDLRVGSPTFGAIDSVVLDERNRKAVFLSEGLGHAICSLEDDSALIYLVSTAYDPAAERTVSPLDPSLSLPLPTDLGELLVSDKDRAAPALGEALDLGLLPAYEDCRARYATLG